MRQPIKVGQGEVTCLNCGETFPATWGGCPRCNVDEENVAARRPGQYLRTPTVPTTEYLRDGEYERL